MNASILHSRRTFERQALRCVLAAAGLTAIGAAANAQILGNCHDDFSNVQGQMNWYYGFYNGDSETPWSIDDFEQLPIFNGLYWTRPEGAGGYWTNISRDGGHPNGTITSGGRTPEVNWAVRRWVSPGDYLIDVSGRTWDASPIPNVGNGIICHIQVDGNEMWTGVVENGNEHGLDYDLRLSVTTGTVIDFAIDPRDGNDFGDDTGCHVVIRSVIDTQPQSAFTCEGGTIFLNVVTIPGDFEYQWRFNGVPIQHEANWPVYRVIGMTPEMVGVYDCVITAPYGTMVSDPAMATICNADVDCDGFLDSRDFFFFLDALFRSDPASDFNRDGQLNSQDFFDFLNAFFAGC
jgi:hypothetical protein